MLGYCTTCTDPGTCAPCSNLNKTRYAVVVSNNVLFNATADRQKYLGSCPATTSSTTTTTSNNGGSSSGSRDSLSEGAKAGIIIAVLVVCFAIVASIYCAFLKKVGSFYIILKAINKGVVGSLENVLSVFYNILYACYRRIHIPIPIRGWLRQRKRRIPNRS